MATDIWYTIRNNRYQAGCVKGFVLEERGVLRSDDSAQERSLFLRALDGVDPGSIWGRLSLKLDISEDMVCYVYVAATDQPELVGDDRSTHSIDDLLTDPEGDLATKLGIFEQLGGKRLVNTQEALLYDLEGRYLYLGIEILGSGKARIEGLRVSARGDNFMAAFPEIYQERNGLFHRYLSIFSTIYNDIGATGEEMHRLLDIDQCPAELLEMYASWFGIDLRGGFLPEETMRAVVREAYQLNKMKGTKRAISRILEIVLGERPILIEQAIASGRRPGGDYEGKSDLDVTVLVETRLTEQRRHQIMWLLDQFKPLRARLHLVQLEKVAVMDGSSYLDLNAAIPGQKHPVLDEQAIYDGALTLM